MSYLTEIISNLEDTDNHRKEVKSYMRNDAAENGNDILERTVNNEREYDLWKEVVRMNSIQVPRHVHHWIANSASETIYA